MSLFPDTPASLLKKIAALKSGDDEAVWTDFIERYTPAVREFMRLKSPSAPEADLDDLVQDVFVRLVEILRAQTYDPAKARFRTYLATIMRNLLVDRWRQKAPPMQQIDQRLGGMDAADPGVVVDAAWRLAARRAAVRHVMSVSMLAQTSKDIYCAYVLEGGEIGEVARRFGVSRNMVSQTKTRIERMIAAVEARYAD